MKKRYRFTLLFAVLFKTVTSLKKSTSLLKKSGWKKIGNRFEMCSFIITFATVSLSLKQYQNF